MPIRFSLFLLLTVAGAPGPAHADSFKTCVKTLNRACNSQMPRIECRGRMFAAAARLAVQAGWEAKKFELQLNRMKPPGFPGSASPKQDMAPTVKASQKQWTAYAKSACAVEHMLAFGGTDRTIYEAQCICTLSMERLQMLRRWRLRAQGKDMK